KPHWASVVQGRGRPPPETHAADAFPVRAVRPARAPATAIARLPARPRKPRRERPAFVATCSASRAPWASMVLFLRTRFRGEVSRAARPRAGQLRPGMVPLRARLAEEELDVLLAADEALRADDAFLVDEEAERRREHLIPLGNVPLLLDQ